MFSFHLKNFIFPDAHHTWPDTHGEERDGKGRVRPVEIDHLETQYSHTNLFIFYFCINLHSTSKRSAILILKAYNIFLLIKQTLPWCSRCYSTLHTFSWGIYRIRRSTFVDDTRGYELQRFTPLMKRVT